MILNKPNDELLARIWLTSVNELGPAGQKRLLEHFENPVDAFFAKAETLALMVSDKASENLIKNRDRNYLLDIYNKCEDMCIKLIYPGHESYPQKLYGMYDYPELLYVRGTIPEHIDEPGLSVAIVGSRYSSLYGSEIAQKFAGELSKNGICIVSGMARGIDGGAHRGALNGDGGTIAVLGCGVNVIYPRENCELYMNILKRGAVISEYAPDEQPKPWRFPVRNRIICGLSDAVLVVEAKEKSGSLITADCALEQGRQVYAIPGRITDERSEGTNNLIKQGAFCVTEPADILRDLKGEENGKQKTEELPPLDERQQKIYDILSLEPVYIDDIVMQVKMSVSEVIGTLFFMEERKIIKQPLKGYYIKCI